MNNRIIKNAILSAVVLIGGASQAFGQFAASGTTSVSVTIGAESAISVTTGTTSLTEATGAGIFGSAFTGTTSFSYKVRTKQTGGTGAITVKFTADFPAGGPTLAAMSYACTVAASGTGCTGPITPSAASATNVATFGTDAHSAAGAGSSDAGSVTWTLPNDPSYKTGIYAATATFTISAA